ncbi:MAG: MerR family transcriptional regulator [Gemmatimonadetes bacterium]|nr:MerR family transcriptional regulator [Gemmatimonadota bacterium]
MSKLYYSSSEVSTMLELEPSVLRFWEDQFGQLRIKRNRAGKRMYREKDIELIRTIKQLTRDEGYTIAGAKKKLQESAANRGAASRGATKTGRTAESALGDAEKAAAVPVKADPGEQPATSPEQAVPGAAPVTSGEQATSGAEPAAPGEQKAPPTATSAQTELIQWLRSNLIEIRNSMD